MQPTENDTHTQIHRANQKWYWS